MKDNQDNNCTLLESPLEEAHCTKCGNYLGEFRQGSGVIIPCSKCRQNNLVDFSGAFLNVKRVTALKGA